MEKTSRILSLVESQISTTGEFILENKIAPFVTVTLYMGAVDRDL